MDHFTEKQKRKKQHLLQGRQCLPRSYIVANQGLIDDRWTLAFCYITAGETELCLTTIKSLTTNVIELEIEHVMYVKVHYIDGTRDLHVLFNIV